ncbi:hypothetical protein [Nesterenkonia muleiensis]|uniref:hypothetical protein n=1 Tax=Nesterenkonia muleiensis TaxID=2282648 RepID=UPI000E71C5BA|nr:hypothetical protein [Nesterenkonia muleiensis]
MEIQADDMHERFGSIGQCYKTMDQRFESMDKRMNLLEIRLLGEIEANEERSAERLSKAMDQVHNRLDEILDRDSTGELEGAAWKHQVRHHEETLEDYNGRTRKLETGSA